MKIFHTIDQIKAWHATVGQVAFVPTMGNLHQGHLALVTRARQLAPHTVVSIFVNPMQFGPNEDFEHYPRTPQADIEQLAVAGVDALFMPQVAEIYPAGVEARTRVEVPGVSQGLCGAHRPGHFTGVATVVAKLFNIVQPDYAVFGEKDYQQLQVIRTMVADLCFPVQVASVATVRDADGLAMSSRNRYLTPAQRDVAPRLYQALCGTADLLCQGTVDFAAIEEEKRAELRTGGLEPEYFSIRQALTLTLPQNDSEHLVVLAAAWLGDTRLIDNLEVTLPRGR